MKSKAALLTKIGMPLQIVELDLPELKPGQVLVKVEFSGICHTQLNEIRGRKGEDKFLPHTLGHEGSGIVEAVGPEVRKVRAGETVVLTWIQGEGMNVPSAQYLMSDGSKVNSGAISTFMDYAVISENRVVPVKKGMSLRELPLLGCAIPTGAGIVFNNIQVSAESVVAVFGVGGVGLSAVIGCYLKKAKTIIAVDIFHHKLELARQVGATHVINGASQDILSVINEITNSHGLDFAIEASGNPKIMETAFKAVRDNGGVCVLAGNLPHGGRISIDPFDLIKGKQITGTWGGGTQPDRDIPNYVDLCMSGDLNLEPLITNTYTLDEINQAFDDMENGKLGRALIQMSQAI